MSKGGGACGYLCKISGKSTPLPPLTKAFPYAYVARVRVKVRFRVSYILFKPKWAVGLLGCRTNGPWTRHDHIPDSMPHSPRARWSTQRAAVAHVPDTGVQRWRSLNGARHANLVDRQHGEKSVIYGFSVRNSIWKKKNILASETIFKYFYLKV